MNRDTGFRQRLFSSSLVGKLLGIDTPDIPAPRFSRKPRFRYEHIVYLPQQLTSFGSLRQQTNARMIKCGFDSFDAYEPALLQGYYGIRTPIAKSNGQNEVEQAGFVMACCQGYRRTPMVLDALSLAVSFLQGDCILHEGDTIRCPEQTTHGRVGFRCDADGIQALEIPCDDFSECMYASACRYIVPES